MKRRDDEAPPPPVPVLGSAKLLRVARALENVTRTPAHALVSGASERFPPPGIAFVGARDDEDDDEELLLPLGKRGVRKIKARGAVTQQHGETATAWAVGTGSLEVRNPMWRDFLDEWLTSVRGALGISPAAEVNVALSKMILAETGARLDTHSDAGSRTSSGVFGTLVVVLPGEFNGGHVSRHGSRPSPATWQPDARGSRYGITYAAFYHWCQYVFEPVWKGAALCLVYDLVTTTPSEVPLFGGASRVQQSVALALADYFDASPASTTKQLKLEGGTPRAILESVVQRPFIYVVKGNSFGNLSGDERKIVNSLAAFCDLSGGQFVLYHTSLVCSSSKVRCTTRGDEIVTISEHVHVTLCGPSTKYCKSAEVSFPTMYLGDRHEVAPWEYLTKIQGWYHVDDMDSACKAIAARLHRGARNVEIHRTHAFVVLPASLERSHLAKIPQAHGSTR